MAKQIVYGDEARQKLASGVNQLAKAVKTTLGPRGRNVAIDRKWGAPNVIHDGVTVAKEIELPDPLENMGAQMVKEAASKTNDVAGDGTTTSTILTQAMVNFGIKKCHCWIKPNDTETRYGQGSRSRCCTGVENGKKNPSRRHIPNFSGCNNFCCRFSDWKLDSRSNQKSRQRRSGHCRRRKRTTDGK